MAKQALVLGAGGVFGAYQAGVWKALADTFEPDLVVGASIGALNGWLIAGGCAPQELEQLWVNFEEHHRIRPRVPRHWTEGWLDLRPVEGVLSDLFARYKPRVEYAAVITDLLRGKPRIVAGGQMTAQHLLASCAVPVAFDLHRFEGRVYADGGLITALPVWAAAELGATHIVAVHVLPDPPRPLMWLRSAGRRFARFREPAHPEVTVTLITPEAPLGRFFHMLRYRRELVERWIAQGERDALRIKQSIAKCFERQ